MKKVIAIDVWKRLDNNGVIRYRCFRVLPDDKYCVQSADFYRLPLEPNTIQNMERQFLELLLQQAPDERAKTFASLEEAIANHDKQFGNPD
ncbi:MAG: hypothetical protein L0Z50_25870 [Verrucomicrobiales bacterium]|nr:hypothetical protein [Verrucomicrobiales bacterium]